MQPPGSLYEKAAAAALMASVPSTAPAGTMPSAAAAAAPATLSTDTCGGRVGETGFSILEHAKRGRKHSHRHEPRAIRGGRRGGGGVPEVPG